MFFNKISERRKLKRVLKNRILETFIAVFNVGETITLQLMEKTRKDLRNILNTDDQVHPNLFNKEQAQRLRNLLNEDLIANGKFNENYLNPEGIKEIIKGL